MTALSGLFEGWIVGIIYVLYCVHLELFDKKKIKISLDSNLSLSENRNTVIGNFKKIFLVEYKKHSKCSVFFFVLIFMISSNILYYLSSNNFLITEIQFVENLLPLTLVVILLVMFLNNKSTVKFLMNSSYLILMSLIIYSAKGTDVNRSIMFSLIYMLYIMWQVSSESWAQSILLKASVLLVIVSEGSIVIASIAYEVSTELTNYYLLLIACSVLLHKSLNSIERSGFLDLTNRDIEKKFIFFLVIIFMDFLV